MIKKATSVLRHKVQGLMYYSEYEYPVTVHETGIISEGDIPSYISSRIAGANTHNIKQIPTGQFFSKFENYLSFGGADEIMNENARQFLDLFEFLKNNFQKIFSYRVENPGEALIPVFIITQTWENEFISIETTAVET